MDWETAWVVAAALCLLVLSTPGVRVVQASDDIALLQTGQTCEGGIDPVNMSLDLMLEQLPAMQFPRAHASGKPAYALNNRGYNYGPRPGVTLPQDVR